MTDRPYTDADLRTEAARQHAALTEDPEFMCVGEAMEDSCAESTSSTWGELLPYNHDDGNAYNAAQRAIHRLIAHAADVSDWAVDLGADGLEPEDHSITVNGGEKPIARIHFAFAPDMPDEMRTALVEGLAEAIDGAVINSLSA